MTARCAQYMSAMKIVCKCKISRRLRKNRHITILSLFGGESVPTNVIRETKRYRRTDNGRYTVTSPRGKTRETKCRRYYRYRRYLKTDMDHSYMYTPTSTLCSYRPKLNETVWSVLQNENEHRLLDSADTKYDNIPNISHLSHKQHCSVVYLQLQWAACAGVDMMWRHTQGSKKINEISAVSSEMSFDGRSLRRPHESPHVVYIFRN